MASRLFFIGMLLVAGCEAPSPPLPPLLVGASSTGGPNYLSEPYAPPPDTRGATTETAAHSPEIVARLGREYPQGTAADKLRSSLLHQGFEIQRCPWNPSLYFARFDQTGGNGITSMAASAIVIWKIDDAARIVWATGDIGFRGP
jgi:hypothetical protein